MKTSSTVAPKIQTIHNGTEETARELFEENQSWENSMPLLTPQMLTINQDRISQSRVSPSFVDLHDIQKSQMEDLFLKLTQSLTNAIQQSAPKINLAVTHPTTLVTFQGLLHEKPSEFISRLELYFKQNNITEETDKLWLAQQQLRGSARIWYDPYKFIINKYDVFVERLINKYD